MDKTIDDNIKTVNFWPGNPYSYTTTQIHTYFDDIFLGPATGFVLRLGQHFGLVTNWHVVSGRNPITTQCLSPTGAIPNRIKFHVTVSTRTGGVEGGKVETRYFKPLDLCLFDNELPIWFDSRTDQSHEDVAVIPLNAHVEELSDPFSQLCAILGGKITFKKGVGPSTGPFKVEELAYFYPTIGSEVFVLGYPRGITSAGILPIWKRGSVASEPQLSVGFAGVEHGSVFYIDALTKSGMSGSPVIYVGEAGEFMYTDDGTQIQLKQTEPFLLGVYAGRDGITQDEHEMSLGRVWKTELIERLLIEAIRREETHSVTVHGLELRNGPESLSEPLPDRGREDGSEDA